MAESANHSTIPPLDTSIEDADGHVWTFRTFDHAVLKDGVHSGISNVMMVWYIDHVIYVFKGTHWRQYDHAANEWIAVVTQFDTLLEARFPGVKRDYFPTIPPAGFPTTAGMRLTPGVKTIASHAGVAIGTGDDPQTIVNANPPGTTYVVSGGTHTNWQVVPKDGDVFIGLTGAVLDSDGSTNFPFTGSGNYVTIRNLTMTGYSPGVQHGMIRMFGAYAIVEYCTILDATDGHAIEAFDFCLVVGCFMSNNNQQAYSVHGDLYGHRPLPGICFYSCQMTDNNPTGGTWGGSEQGGGKSLDSFCLSFMFCWSGRNQGSNLWFDYNNMQSLVWGCVIGGDTPDDEETGWNGIELEISQTAKLLYNEFNGIDAGPGGLAGFFSCAAIFLGNSGGTDGGLSEFAHNTITSSFYGRALTGRMQSRSLQDIWGIAGQPRWIDNTFVHDNIIDFSASGAITDGCVGLLTDNGSDLIFFGPSKIRFDYNTYIAGPMLTPFAWNYDMTMPFSAWQATAGQDLHSTFSSDDPPPATWSTSDKNTNVSISGGGLVATGTGTGGISYPGRGTTENASISAGQSIFWKVVMTNVTSTNAGIGLCSFGHTFEDENYPGTNFESYGWYGDGNVVFADTVVETGHTFVEGDEIGLAVRGGAATGRFWLYKNGVFINGNPTTGEGGLSHAWSTAFPCYVVRTGDIITAEFAADDPPSGFVSFPTP